MNQEEALGELEAAGWFWQLRRERGRFVFSVWRPCWTGPAESHPQAEGETAIDVVREIYEQVMRSEKPK